MQEERLKMHTTNKVDKNIELIGKLFPNTLTETIKGTDINGKPIVEKAIDFDILRQELSNVLVEGPAERYQMNWPDKRKAIMLANQATDKTLRPCREESVDFDNTENLYIEGDNLEVLKLLQETYLNRVKIIYIDPPYNTGKDSFVYEDDYTIEKDEFGGRSSQYDMEGNLLYNIRQNNELDGRYHTNWLNMIYPRLKLCKDLLTDDGIIFISIDDREHSNLKKICNEIFGESNCVGNITWEKRTKAQNTETAREQLQSKTEYILVYKKQSTKMQFNLEVTGEKIYDKLDENGVYREKIVEEMSALGMRGRETMIFPIQGVLPGEGKQWKVGKDTVNIFEERGDVFIKEGRAYFKIRPNDENGQKFAPFWSHFFDKEIYGTAESGKSELSEVLGTKGHGFETVKPVSLIKKLIFHVKGTNGVIVNKDDIILDFFSGSGSTAEAVMQMNLEDGGRRKYILVQIPEQVDENSDTYKAGFNSICELAKTRISRAGQRIKKENQDKAKDLDTGFRVLKLASSNMKDVYYTPGEYSQATLGMFEDNIKEDRSAEDLLFQVMLELDELLSSDIKEMTIAGKKVFNVADGNIIACFDTGMTEEVVIEIAKMQPYYAVFRDNCMASDSVATNFEQIFKTYSPSTVRKVL